MFSFKSLSVLKKKMKPPNLPSTLQKLVPVYTRQNRIQDDPVAEDHSIMLQVHVSFKHNHRNFTIPAGDLFKLYLLINSVCEWRSIEVGALFDVFTASCLEKWKLVGVAR